MSQLSTILPLVTITLLLYCVYSLYRILKNTDSGKRLYFFTIGTFGWLLSEAIWLMSGGLSCKCTTIFSIANVFWLFGYILLAIGGIVADRSIFTKSRTKEYAIALIVSVVGVLFLYYNFVNVITSSANIYSKLMNIVFPLFDLFLLYLSLAIISKTFSRNIIARAWVFLGAGLLVLGSSDLLRTYLIFSGSTISESTFSSLLGFIHVLVYFFFIMACRSRLIVHLKLKYGKI